MILSHEFDASRTLGITVRRQAPSRQPSFKPPRASRNCKCDSDGLRIFLVAHSLAQYWR